MARSNSKNTAKPVKSGRKTTRFTLLLGKIKNFLIKFTAYFLGITVLWVLLLRWINPPLTPLMVQRWMQNIGNDNKPKFRKDWVNFEDLGKQMPKAVIASEDQLFLSHYGFDIAAMKKAYESNKKGKKIKGGSTISQQTAKNVFLFPTRTYLRKALEAYFTILIEILWSKERILEVYLNVIEMGNGVYGTEAAAQLYFKKSANKLSANEAARIAAILPSPRRYSVTKPGPYVKRRSNSIEQQMRYIDLRVLYE